MTQPPIIGSGQPHTVTLAPGSNTATHKQPRVAAPTPQAPRPQFRPASRPEVAKPNTARPAPPTEVPAPASPEPEPESILSPHILQRISGLQERNESVRAELDRLPASLGLDTDPRRTP